MSRYREDPEPRRADLRVAAQTFPCSNCDMPIHAGDPMRLEWFGWIHDLSCPTEVTT